jgi:putative flippase GtrA
MKQQFVNYILIGIINTIFGYGLYALFIYFGFSYFYAMLFATILGVLFNFKTIGKFVFKSNNNSLLLKFIVIYAAGFLINIYIVKTLKSFNYNDYISGAISIAIISVATFLLNKYYVFKG